MSDVESLSVGRHLDQEEICWELLADDPGSSIAVVNLLTAGADITKLADSLGADLVDRVLGESGLQGLDTYRHPTMQVTPAGFNVRYAPFRRRVSSTRRPVCDYLLDYFQDSNGFVDDGELCVGCPHRRVPFRQDTDPHLTDEIRIKQGIRQISGATTMGVMLTSKPVMRNHLLLTTGVELDEAPTQYLNTARSNELWDIAQANNAVIAFGSAGLWHSLKSDFHAHIFPDVESISDFPLIEFDRDQRSYPRDYFKTTDKEHLMVVLEEAQTRRWTHCVIYDGSAVNGAAYILVSPPSDAVINISGVLDNDWGCQRLMGNIFAREIADMERITDDDIKHILGHQSALEYGLWGTTPIGLLQDNSECGEDCDDCRFVLAS